MLCFFHNLLETYYYYLPMAWTSGAVAHPCWALQITGRVRCFFIFVAAYSQHPCDLFFNPFSIPVTCSSSLLHQ